MRRRASLGAAFVEWDEADRNPDYLFSGTRLEEYEEWSGSSTVALTSAEQLFLDEAIDRRESENQVDAERTAREQALDRRARVRTWALAAVVTAMAGVGAWLLFFAGPGEEPPRVARVEFGFSADFFLDQMENGWNQAQREFELTFDEKLTPVSDASAELLDLVRTEPDLVVLGALAGEASELVDVVRGAPDQLFAMPDRWHETLPNLVTFEYASHEDSFLAGAAAALTSRTGIIGLVGGHPDVIAPFRSGYEAGARFADPDVEVLSTYLVGDFFDVFVVGANAPAVTNALIDEGADIIYHAFGDPGALVLTAVAARGTDAWVIGVDVDQSLNAPDEERDRVLTSMLKRHDLAIVEILRRLEAGTLTAGTITGDVSNGVMGLVTPGNMEESVVVRIEEIRQAIIDGTIEVPELPDRPPIRAIETDYSVDVSVVGQECAVDGFTPLTGDVVRFDIVNPTDVVMRIGLFKIIDGIPVDALTLQGLFSGEQSFLGFETGGVVAARSTNALTVLLDEPGDWILNCYVDRTDGLNPSLIQVSDPEASTERTVLVNGASDDGRPCSSDLSDLHASDVVSLTIVNDGPDGVAWPCLKLRTTRHRSNLTGCPGLVLDAFDLSLLRPPNQPAQS